MNIVLFDKPLTKKELVHEILISCNHILDVDVIREDIVNYRELNNKIYPFLYSIKEYSKISKENKKQLLSIDHILFYQYPEYDFTSRKIQIVNNQKTKNYISSEYKKPLEHFVSKLNIPLFLNNTSLSDLQYQSNIAENLSIIEQNLLIIQKSYLNNSKKWAIYVYIYKDIIEELLKSSSFNKEEIQNIEDIFNNIKTLLAIVESDIANMEHLLQKQSMYQIQKENYEYIKLLENINYIEIKLTPLENSEWIYDHCSGFKITQIGDNFRIFSEFPDKLLTLYSKILSLKKKNLVFLKMDNVDENQYENTITHTIETNSNIWAYVYYKMYGENIDYSQKNDYEVTNILNTAKKLNLPIEYLI